MLTQESKPDSQTAVAPFFASPLHAEDAMDSAQALPPMFMKSFESTEETLPFQLSVVSGPGESSEVVAKPIAAAPQQQADAVEEIKEELVELELEAELKWIKR